MAEKLANNAVSTLNGAINSYQTTAIISNASLFPTSGNFTLLIENELVIVTALSNNSLNSTFTIVRGTEGTANVSHSDTNATTLVLSNRSLHQLINETLPAGGGGSTSVTFGTIANLPAASSNGAIYACTDWPLWFRDNGGNMTPFGPIFPLESPPLAGWAINNFNSSSGVTNWTQKADGSIFLYDQGTSSEHIRSVLRNIPNRPFNITIGILPLLLHDSGDYPAVGLIIQEASSDKRLGFTYGTTSGTPSMDVYQWDNGNSSAANHYATNKPPPFGGMLFLRIAENVSARTLSFSTDGQNFLLFFTQSANTALAADHIGIMVDAVNSFALGMTLLSYSEAP